MARRKRKSAGRIIASALVLAALAAAGWFAYRHLDRQPALIKVSAERVDPANEGRPATCSWH